jgi:preprotein translocase subunit SecF
MVVLIFIPMVVSTFIGFWFCSFFFSHLNVVTSFLFSIIFGLGVDIGIHLINRYIYERHDGASPAQAHRRMLTRTGATAAISILTTVASFYVLIFFDFKGFYDFGWIAGNGLVIALLTYLIFFPPLILLADRLHLLIKMPHDKVSATRVPPKRPRLRFATPALLFFAVLTFLSILGVWRFDFMRVGFQYDFNTLKMQLAERVELKKKLKTTTGRVNSPAFYLLKNEIEARQIKKIIEERKASDPDTTIEFFRSYYDLFPRDQEERLSVLKEIEVLLADDVLTTLPKDEYDLVAEMHDSIKDLRPIRESEIPVDLYEMFWGNTGPGAFWRRWFTILQEDFLVMWGPRRQHFSVAFVSPLPQLELDNGQNAEAFYEDVHVVDTLGNKYYAISDSIVFAEVLGTLFRDSRFAIVASLVLLLTMIFFHFRNVKRTAFVLLGLGCGFSWMLALMGLCNIRLNFYNMIVLPTMIGMGEDNSVHVIDRHDEFGRRSILHVLRISGGASLMASLTTMFGYGGLLFARHPGLNSIGIMSIIGMGTCLIGSLVVLPLLAHIFMRPEESGS